MFKYLKIISGTLGLCFWFSSYFIWKYLDARMPTTADPQKGRTYPLDTHGSIVYLTSVEHYALYALTAIGAGLVLVAIALSLIEKTKS